MVTITSTQGGGLYLCLLLCARRPLDAHAIAGVGGVHTSMQLPALNPNEGHAEGATVAYDEAARQRRRRPWAPSRAPTARSTPS